MELRKCRIAGVFVCRLGGHGGGVFGGDHLVAFVVARMMVNWRKRPRRRGHYPGAFESESCRTGRWAISISWSLAAYELAAAGNVPIASPSWCVRVCAVRTAYSSVRTVRARRDVASRANQRGSKRQHFRICLSVYEEECACFEGSVAVGVKMSSPGITLGLIMRRGTRRACKLRVRRISRSTLCSEPLPGSCPSHRPPAAARMCLAMQIPTGKRKGRSQRESRDGRASWARRLANSEAGLVGCAAVQSMVCSGAVVQCVVVQCAVCSAVCSVQCAVCSVQCAVVQRCSGLQRSAVDGVQWMLCTRGGDAVW